MSTTPITTPALPPQPRVLRRAFAAAAVGRILLGASAFASPRSQTRMNGVPDQLLSTETKYLIRIFGARALALGIGYLGSDELNRRRWQYLGLMVDTLDNLNAAMELKNLERGDPRVRSLLSLVAVTGPYAMLGAVGAIQRHWVR
ncbi:hypothetical protein AWC27_03765 [Mycobacterium szulgai]|uniref:Aspartate carbamoyl transferase n=2 Tax=Mycobacterium szulgai TaxID=1787 RepID=A0A1X2EDZ2_MYCSZ|nr:hypothetical protein [Mycobacterium szulgai]MCV7076061.1 hypothetical protein [Mycobacterium szulgai]ORW98580.1 hypothetical protein AWC27_03765 [Mycobacterium szulgai]